MIKWIKVFFLGVLIWFLLTFLYGFSIGILDLDTSGSFENNLILLPVGIYLGFKIIEYKENKSSKNDKSYKDHIDKTSKGVEEELSKVKSNKSTNPIDNQLVSDQHLSALSWTVSCWRLTVENSTNKMMKEKKVAKFCRLFLAQEKKRKKIKDYNRADVRLLYTISIVCSISTTEKLIAKNGWTYKVGKAFEKEIGYR